MSNEEVIRQRQAKKLAIELRESQVELITKLHDLGNLLFLQQLLKEQDKPPVQH